MPNPDGVNGWGGFTQEAPYGSQRELETRTRAEPLPGARGVNSPKRDQRRATRPARPAAAAQQQQPVEAPTPATPQPQIAYPLQIAGIWRQLAAEPGASDLVKTLAQQAIQEASLG